MSNCFSRTASLTRNPAPVDRHQQRPVLEVARRFQQPLDLLQAQHARSVYLYAVRRDLQLHLRPFQYLAVETVQTTAHPVVARPRQVPPPNQVNEVGLDLLTRQLIGSPPVVGRQTLYRPHIRLLRAWRQVSQHHVVKKLLS